WISRVRPPCLPRAASRVVRVWVERGSMPYSAVIHPRPVPTRWGGTFSSTLAVTTTRVLPKETSADPSAWGRKFGTISTGRSSPAALPFLRIFTSRLGTGPSSTGLCRPPRLAGGERPSAEGLDPVRDPLGDPLLDRGRRQPLLLAGMGDVPHLDEDGGHPRPR